MSGMDFYPEWVEKYHVNTTKLSECIEQWDYLYQKHKGQIFLCRLWPGIMVWANKVFMETLPCETAGVSPSSLKKYFAKVYGCPISEYSREKRMEYACALLRDTDQSIADIAEQTGYAHQGKFGTVFKKHTGQPPLEYRRRNRKWKQDTNTGGKRE